MKYALLLVLIVMLVGCVVGYGAVVIEKLDPCATVAARVGYPNAITQEDGEFCRIYIGQDVNGNDVWASAKK